MELLSEDDLNLKDMTPEELDLAGTSGSISRRRRTTSTHRGRMVSLSCANGRQHRIGQTMVTSEPPSLSSGLVCAWAR
jgi:hypothetical protein